MKLPWIGRWMLAPYTKEEVEQSLPLTVFNYVCCALTLALITLGTALGLSWLFWGHFF